MEVAQLNRRIISECAQLYNRETLKKICIMSPRRRYKKRSYPLTGQHIIYLGPTHAVEVKKGGLYIGIYIITASNRRRGVILPQAVWTDLQNSIDVINLAIELAGGKQFSTTPHSTNEPHLSSPEGCQYGVTPANAAYGYTSWANAPTHNAPPAPQFFANTPIYQNTTPTWGEAASYTAAPSSFTYPNQWCTAKTDNNYNSGNIGPNPPSHPTAICQETCPVFTDWLTTPGQTFQTICCQT